jgi:hypothetical protein
MKDEGYNKGGLKTSGATVDPVSGNEGPTGAEPSEVRDNVDAKLSEGEYVVPADVVKFFGVDHFEKLRAKAKKGLSDMEEDGRVGGEPTESGYNQGGMVVPNLDELISNARVRASKDPEFVRVLASKGIVLQDTKDSGQALQGNMGSPIEMNQGGMVPDYNSYFSGQVPGATSGFNSADYDLGFSSRASVTTPSAMNRCGPGTVWDETLQMCVLETPQAQAAAAPAPAPTATEGEAPEGSFEGADPGKWMEKYDYSNPEVLVEQTMTTLGGSEENSILGQIGGFVGSALSGGLVGGIVNKAFKTQRYSEAMANAEVLRAQGLTTEATQIESAASTYAKDNSLRPGGLLDSSKRLTEFALDEVVLPSTKAQPAPTTRSVGESPQTTAPQSSARPVSRGEAPKSVTPGATDKYVGRTDSSGRKAGDAGYQSALGERQEAETVSKGQEAGKGYKGGYGFNKGGFVKPRYKKQ